MRGKLVVGNWKMNGGLNLNESLLKALRARADGSMHAKLAVCVPFPYLAQTQSLLAGSPIKWGAQDVSEHAGGAYTGEVSVAMLKDFECRYALVGHSERRTLYGDTDRVVAAKAEAVLSGGLTAIVCVGETLEEREAGTTDEVVTRQLDAVLGRIGAEADRAVFAYEPVWAIGTGRTATPEQAQAVHRLIRTRLASVALAAGDIPLLYGGSVKADNAKALFGMADIDGALVGGASLKSGEFLAIADA